MKKTTITLFSISTIFAVLIIAVVILLIGNYTKNLNSGINLEFQTLQNNINLINQTESDMVWVLSDPSEVDKNIFQDLDTTVLSSQIVFGILGQEQLTGGFELKLNNARLRGQQITINYHIQNLDSDSVVQVIIYPEGMFTISKDKLPAGTPLEFVFYNQTTKDKIIINKTITL